MALAGICRAQLITTVEVGDPGNRADTGGLGAVAEIFSIGVTEVTNAQYVTFLNLAAASDPYGLYNTNMGSQERGGILRSGISGEYTYSVKENMGDKPVNYVSWFDAARLSNWLQNGSTHLASTEHGAYSLNGTESDVNIEKSLHAKWWIPSASEWYKAAYYMPLAAEGSYSLFPSQSDYAPAEAAATATGNVANPGANIANYHSGAEWNGMLGNVVTVGSSGSASAYGVFDMGGNVFEWTDGVGGTEMTHRVLRGGSWVSSSVDFLASNFSLTYLPQNEYADVGMRLATVPEPSALVLFGYAAAFAIARTIKKT